jgi:hypothetical protein
MFFGPFLSKLLPNLHPFDCSGGIAVAVAAAAAAQQWWQLVAAVAAGSGGGSLVY